MRLSMRQAALAALFCGLSAVQAVVSTPASAEPPSWAVDQQESRLVFVATQLGASFEGEFRVFEAEIRFAPDALAASEAAVTIDVGSLDTGESQRDDTAKGAAFFDVANHPQARFQTTAFRAEGDGYVADGMLTMKAIEKPVALPFTLQIDGDVARMRGSLTIDRTEWTVGTGEWTSGDTVGKEVEIRIELTARK